MAVKYHIDGLRDLAAQKFKAEVDKHWNHEDLAHAIHVIYTSTADEVTQLRETAAGVLSNHPKELLEKAEIATVLRSINGLAYDLLLRGPTAVTAPVIVMASNGRSVVCYNHEVHGDGASSDLPFNVDCNSCLAKFDICILCAEEREHGSFTCRGCEPRV